MKNKWLVLRFAATMVLVLTFVLGSSSEVLAAKSTVTEGGIFIVQMLDEPVVAYEGTVTGFKATAPKDGEKINPKRPDVIKYVSYLKNKHDEALSKVGGGKKLYNYTYTFNGFAAELSATQADKMKSIDGVLAVTVNEFYEVDTSSTPSFLGLTEPGGLWDQLGGVKSAGENIIIGVIDSGIWPESLSFTDRTFDPALGKVGKLAYQQIPGWHGKCVPGEAWNASMCNQKLIGAQYFNAGQGGDAAIDFYMPWEFVSARDYNGHGTHTSSTAGGNYGVLAAGPTEALGKISGIAPRARIAMYKALWSAEDASTASGTTSDLVEAIDQAVADGVDVINYSVSGSQTNFRDPVEISFLYAANAGVFVAASAGNSGPTTATVAHPSPWITTVAAGTHNRTALGSVTLGDGSTLYGASLASTAVTAPLIDSIYAGLPGANTTALALCYSSLDGGNLLDPAKVAGKIFLCDRGTTARVNKSYAVMEAGGVGMILVNPTASTLNADFHSVPTVHLQNTDYTTVHAYAATSGATATINKSTLDYTTPAPYTASFSSRGPLKAGNGDLLKPDVIAPGVDILAAVSPMVGGLNFNLYQGTSMSSPHVAGLAALFKDLYPTWTPMMIKSALMTSAYDILDGPNTNPLVIFRQGAGHVQPNKAMNPGLVFNSGWNDWLGFLCGTGMTASYCPSIQIDPSNLNVASIAIGDMAGSQTVTRKVTNVGGLPATYTPSYTGMTGFNVVVAPTSLTLNPGQTGTFTVTFTRTTAALNAYTGGQLTWTDGSHVVRLPMVVRPVALAAPVAVYGTGDPISYNVTFGYTGPFTATARGLVPAVTEPGSVNTGEQVYYEVTIPAGTTYARFSLFDTHVSPASDLDLYVYNSGGTQVGGSGSGTSNEEVNLLNPAAGLYYVEVDGYATADPSTFTLFYWLLDSTDAGNMTVSAPSTATTGAIGTINLSFTGLAAATKYLGSVAYDGVEGLPNPTIVRVDTQ